MIPLSDVDVIREAAGFQEVREEVMRSGNSRYPVVRSDPSDMVGTLNIKDLLVHSEGAEENWRQYVRPLIFCTPQLEADELLRDMQLQRNHMAAVEEHGQVIGIVTMEDILEEIVGDIEDEHDTERPYPIREVSSGRYLVQGDVEVDNLCKVINIDLGPTDGHLTLAGWFERGCLACGGPIRRLKVGHARIIQRPGGRFEILVRGPAPMPYGDSEEVTE
jgi:magnesium and cobalt transporter